MLEIYAHEHPHSPYELDIFLAGPSPRNAGDYNWRPEAIDCFRKRQFSGVVYIPLPRDGNWLLDYDAQAEWELKYLNKAKVIMFWIPRDLVCLPGFTTNVEFGMFAKSGKVVLGYPKGVPKMRYLRYLAGTNNIPVCHQLDMTVEAAILLASKK